VKAFAFGAHDDDGMIGPGDAIVGRVAALIQAIDKVAHVLEGAKGLIDIAGAHDRQVFESSGGCFGNGIGQAHGAPLGDDDRSGPGGMRGTDDSAKVMRVFHAVENNDESGSRRYILKLRVLFGGSESDDSLMGAGAGQAVERVAFFETDGCAGLAGEIDDFLDASSAESAGDEDALQRALSAKRFDNGMDSGEDGQI
jgi:hypothetical protein